jgi:hypothetical protein
MKMIEHNNQVTLVMWVRAFKPDLLLVSMPNGGYRKAAEAIRLKSEGVVAGMPDLMLLEASGGFHGLFIEMKTEVGKLSKKQIEAHQALIERGYKVVTCHSYDQGRQAIEDYLSLGCAGHERS